jgi:hypothetical protein
MLFLDTLKCILSPKYLSPFQQPVPVFLNRGSKKKFANKGLLSENFWEEVVTRIKK